MYQDNAQDRVALIGTLGSKLKLREHNSKSEIVTELFKSPIVTGVENLYFINALMLLV